MESILSREALCAAHEPHQALTFPKPLESSQSNHKGSLAEAAELEQKIRVRTFGGLGLGVTPREETKALKISGILTCPLLL